MSAPRTIPLVKSVISKNSWRQKIYWSENAEAIDYIYHGKNSSLTVRWLFQPQ
jgi:hypothetical protein